MTGKKVFHGWLSLVLLSAVAAVALVAISRYSLPATAGFLALSAVAGAIVVYAFCAKCPCRSGSCGHIVFGPLSRVFPLRKQGPYTIVDIGATAACMAAIILYPQYWLVKQIPLLAAFWSVTAVLLVDILVFICRGCGNAYCPAQRGLGIRQ